MKKSLFLTILLCLLTTAVSFGQCTFVVSDGQPYVEDFEGDVFSCWTVDESGGGSWMVMPGEVSKAAVFRHDNVGEEARLISPVLDLSGISEALFTFSYAMISFDQFDELVICYRSSESDSWHELGMFSFSDMNNFFEQTYELPDISATYQVSFLGRGFGGLYVIVDNVEVASSNSCARPMNLEVDNVTAHTALLSWSATGNEESWTVELNGNVVTANEVPYLAEDLEPYTNYSFRVKAKCNDDSESQWSTPIAFMTTCDVFTVTDNEPYFDDFESSSDFICWNNEVITGIMGWIIDPGTDTPNNSAYFTVLAEEARLMSLPLNLTSVANPVLEFKYKQPLVSSGSGLSVWYRTTATGQWYLLESFGTIISDWTTVSIELPNPSEEYQISFLGLSNGTAIIYVDDVYVGVNTLGVIEAQTVSATVSPNPTRGKVYVNANVTEGRVTVFDMCGKKVSEAILDDGRTELDMSELPEGVYMARVYCGDGVTTVKVVVK